MSLPEELDSATVTATVTAPVNFGSRIEKNRVREVFWIKLLNRRAAGLSNTVNLFERASGGSPKLVDTWRLVSEDTQVWPDELPKDGRPLYTIKTDNASVKYIRASAEGYAHLRMLFRDLP